MKGTVRYHKKVGNFDIALQIDENDMARILVLGAGASVVNMSVPMAIAVGEAAYKSITSLRKLDDFFANFR